MNTTLTSRVLAGSTVAGLLLVGAASGVFGTFSTTILSGNTCSGYGYQAGYGYGYDCTPIATPTTSGGGGGSSSSTTAPIVIVTNTGVTVTPPVSVTPSVVVFPDFTPSCGSELENLTDPRLVAYYSDIGVVNQSNTGRKLTRAEFLKLVLNSAGVDVTAEANPSYSDVSASHSLRKYIAYATRNAIVSGQNGKFRPDDLISRAEAAKILVRGADIDLSATIDAFSDVSVSSSLAPYVQTAFDNCILHGRRTVNGESTLATRIFEPADGITLAETTKVLYNINN
jgi:S-layer homology domain